MAVGKKKQPAAKRRRLRGRRRLSMNEMIELVRKFNEKFPVGTAVKLLKHDGTLAVTSVLFQAEVLNRSCVCWFAGFSGYFLIEDKDRVQLLYPPPFATVEKASVPDAQN